MFNEAISLRSILLLTRLGQLGDSSSIEYVIVVIEPALLRRPRLGSHAKLAGRCSVLTTFLLEVTDSGHWIKHQMTDRHRQSASRHSAQALYVTVTRYLTQIAVRQARQTNVPDVQYALL